LSPSLHESTPARRIFDRFTAVCVRGTSGSVTPGLSFSSLIVSSAGATCRILPDRSANPDALPVKCRGGHRGQDLSALDNCPVFASASSTSSPRSWVARRPLRL
jgi:hypothetical protein